MTETASTKSKYLSEVISTRAIAPGLTTIRFRNERIARTTRAGQFVNVLPRAGENDPMLRRPFSVYQCWGDEAEIIVQVHGRGTDLISRLEAGDVMDIIGPLGQPWKWDSGDYKTAVLVIGGVGVASMPLLTRHLAMQEIPVLSYYGARSAMLVARDGLNNLRIATDDGSSGYHGTNIQMLRDDLASGAIDQPKLFVCGPTGMMRAAKQLAEDFDIPCELSLETEMACGVGICQGCPVVTDESTFAESGKRFRLVCMEGPSFDSRKIVI